MIDEETACPVLRSALRPLQIHTRTKITGEEVGIWKKIFVVTATVNGMGK